MSKNIKIVEEEGQLYKVEMVEKKEPVSRELVEEQYKLLSEQYLNNEEELDALYDKQCELSEKMFLIQDYVPSELKVKISEDYIDNTDKKEEGEMLIDKNIIEEHLPEEVNTELNNNEEETEQEE